MENTMILYQKLWNFDFIWEKKYGSILKFIYNSTMVIAKIKGMPRSLFYVIPPYVTMDYEK